MSDQTSRPAFQSLWASLSHLQRQFVIAMTQHSTKRDAAFTLGIQPDTVYRWPPAVDQALDLILQDILQAAWDVLRHAAAEAAFVKTEAMHTDDEKIRQQAATEILNRILGRAYIMPANLPLEEPQSLIVKYVDQSDLPPFPRPQRADQ